MKQSFQTYLFKFKSPRLQARMATKKAKPNGQFYLKSEKVEEFFKDVTISGAVSGEFYIEISLIIIIIIFSQICLALDNRFGKDVPILDWLRVLICKRFLFKNYNKNLERN